MERGIMKKSKNVTRIKCKMISLCLSSVMIISSFISINVMADSSDQIINSLTDIPAVLEEFIIEKHLQRLDLQHLHKIIRRH